MGEHAYNERAEVPRDSAHSNLVDAVERLHHQIGILEERLTPVMRMANPALAQIDKEEPRSAIEHQIRSINEATDRVRSLIDRCAL